jgi:peptidoglycan/LPS O-acetylase OafA/YrhL
MPLYFLQEGIAVIGLLWLAQSLAALSPGRFLAYVGRRSMPLLLLHGWLILLLYGLIGPVLPRGAGVWLFGIIFAVNTVLHLALYRLLQRPLDRFIALCSAASHRLMRLLPRASRRGPLAPPG